MKLSQIVEASQERQAFNKYNAVELMSQLMGLLKKYNLDDALDAFSHARHQQGLAGARQGGFSHC